MKTVWKYILLFLTIMIGEIMQNIYQMVLSFHLTCAKYDFIKVNIFKTFKLKPPNKYCF